MQNEELPPQPTLEMINQVLAYLSGLSNQGKTPRVFSAPAPQVPGVQHAAAVAPPHGCLIGNRHVSSVDYRAYNDK